MRQPIKTKTLSVSIAASPSAVYEFASNPKTCPNGRGGFAKSMTLTNDGWVVETSESSVAMCFVNRNALGVLDHVVTLPQDLEILNPMRAIPNGSGSEVLFTLFQTENLSDKRFAEDVKFVRMICVR